MQGIHKKKILFEDYCLLGLWCHIVAGGNCCFHLQAGARTSCHLNLFSSVTVEVQLHLAYGIPLYTVSFPHRCYSAERARKNMKQDYKKAKHMFYSGAYSQKLCNMLVVLVDLRGFRRRCTALRITGFLDIVHRPLFYKLDNTAFLKRTLLAPLQGADLKHWTMSVQLQLYEYNT
jgi:hypothetical protein